MRVRLLLLSLLLCGASGAQDAPRDLTPLGLLQLDREETGKRARLEGLRYRGWRKPVLRTYRQGLNGKLYVKAQGLSDQLKQDRDDQGASLVPYRSNIVVEGTLIWGGEELGVLLEVDSLVVQADDVTRLRETLSDLAPDDRAGRLKLRAQVRARLVTAHAAVDRKSLREFDAELNAQLQATNLERLGELPDAAQAWLEAGTSENDLTVLAQAWAHPGTSPALKQQLGHAMTSRLKARRLEGAWYSPAEFKHALGFRRHLNRSGELVWMSTLRAELLESISDTLALLALKKSSPFGSSLAEVLERAVSNGDVLRGMSKDHMVRIQHEGRPYLPTSVTRMIDPAIEESPEVVWEQWVMPDGLRVYWYNGIVCSKVPRPESD